MESNSCVGGSMLELVENHSVLAFFKRYHVQLVASLSCRLQIG